MILIVTALIACENNVAPQDDSFVGFWKAAEVSQHFWLDENIDSLSGFGQIAWVNSLGYLEWIPLVVEGTGKGRTEGKGREGDRGADAPDSAIPGLG